MFFTISREFWWKKVDFHTFLKIINGEKNANFVADVQKALKAIDPNV